MSKLQAKISLYFYKLICYNEFTNKRKGGRTMYDDTFFIVYGIVMIIVFCIFGAVTRHINQNKGYDGGFAWGFFLGVIGIIVVACRQPAVGRKTYESPALNHLLHAYAQEEERKRILRDGGWKCEFCDRANYKYVTTCLCGKSKKETENKLKEN